MGFIDFVKKQWKKHQINEERKRIERARLRRLARDAEVVGFHYSYGEERARLKVRDEYARYKRQREASKPENVINWMFEDPFKKRKKRRK